VLWVVLIGVCLAQASDQVAALQRPRFVAVDVVVDSKGVGLGAYQLEVKTPVGTEIVGLEGGEGLFAEAPFYDPKALMGRRIVMAAFSTQGAEKLPHGPTRVARLHLQTSGGAGGGAGLDKKLVVATDSHGKTIPADVTLKIFEGANR